MPSHSIDAIGKAIVEHSPTLYQPTKTTRQAAVAIVLHEEQERTNVLFIKRATFEGDPWSGDMAFPGGHKDPADNSFKDAAIRETFEEIGLDLAKSEHIGPLSHQRASNRGRAIDMIVAPHVFAVDQIPPLVIDEREVDEVVWGSFDAMIQGNILDVEYKTVGDSAVQFNGYRLSVQHFVWGLTYRTLQTLFSAVDPSYSPAEDPV